MSAAWSYPVTPLAAFDLSSAFGKSDAIDATAEAACPAMPVDANANRCQQVDLDNQ
jgi:hypothetical protein